ncbi:hypothetical protein EDE05_11994 [Neorhizobium sp. R1-B]|jgi:hypothetical protein|nr:hypothetical protein EDE09_1221 [Neorhizobium sp. S3-V5DH]TDX75165.1 hypothetical protein EDE05_11994 [Neorhizobium sp. R1-B]
MVPEERIRRHEETIARLREDKEWLRDTGFWTEAGSNEDLIGEIERAINLYISLIRELTRPVG